MNDADRELIDRLLDDDLPPHGQAALLERIEGNAADVAEFAERALLHAGLQQALQCDALQRTALLSLETPKSIVVSWQRWLPWGIAAACVVAMLTMLARWPVADVKKVVEAPSESVDRFTAMLVDEAGSVFAKSRQHGEVSFD